jgi:uncharacterized coiled-coil DUF342 family protein
MTGKQCLVMILCLVFLGSLTSCGPSKKDFEDVKTQLSDLTAKTKSLSELNERLTIEKSGLTKELDSLKDKNSALSAESDQYKKDASGLAQKNEELSKTYKQLEVEVGKLKVKNDQLSAQVAELKKKQSQSADHPSPQADTNQPLRFKEDSSSQAVKPRAALTPCDALIEYMLKSREIVQKFKNPERKTKLEELYSAYSSKIDPAPAKAKKAAVEWVKELSRSWDKHHNETVSRLLRLRNTVLNECGKSPAEAGL